MQIGRGGETHAQVESITPVESCESSSNTSLGVFVHGDAKGAAHLFICLWRIFMFFWMGALLCPKISKFIFSCGFGLFWLLNSYWLISSGNPLSIIVVGNTVKVWLCTPAKPSSPQRVLKCSALLIELPALLRLVFLGTVSFCLSDYCWVLMDLMFVPI